MKFKHLWAVTLKELRHIRRDSSSLILFLFSPTFLLIVFAYSVTADVKHVPIAILDLDNSSSSREIIQDLIYGEELDLFQYVTNLDEIDLLFQEGKIKAGLIIPNEFESNLLGLRHSQLQILIDGTEPQSGGFAADFISNRVGIFIENKLSEALSKIGLPNYSTPQINLKIQNWYNPNLKTSWDLVPGLISIVLGMPGLAIAQTLAREREQGTLEQLIVTPISKVDLLLGKMLPYLISGMLSIGLTSLTAVYWFNVPFQGNFPLYFLLSSIYFLAILSMGMVIGSVIKSQSAAIALALLVIFFPGFFLTGVFFPISSMPPIMRTEALALPGTHFAIITRASWITQASFQRLLPYGLTLLIMTIIFVAIASILFRKRLG